jgi:hypothetical protein
MLPGRPGLFHSVSFRILCHPIWKHNLTGFYVKRNTAAFCSDTSEKMVIISTWLYYSRYASLLLKVKLRFTAEENNRISLWNLFPTQAYSTNLAGPLFCAQNYWVFGLCPSSGILETRKHNVSETGSVSVLKWGGGIHLHCSAP